MTKCIYRTPNLKGIIQIQDFRGEAISQRALPVCQVLAEKGMNDTTCYNEESDEKNCRISSIYKKPEGN